jgi:small subunit ribosomal protein S16
LAVAIRLTRVGATKRPAYRVIAIDKRRSRDGRALEILGYYDPLTEPATVRLETDKIKAWIGKGAQPSDTVVKLMRQAEATEQAGPDAPAPKRATRSAGAKPSRKAAAKAQAAATAAEAPTEEATAAEDASAPTEAAAADAEAAAPAEPATEAAAAEEPAPEPSADEASAEAPDEEAPAADETPAAEDAPAAEAAPADTESAEPAEAGDEKASEA